MKQTRTGDTAVCTFTSSSKKNRISRSMALLGGLFMAFAANNANAQIYVNGLEGVVTSGVTANNGGVTTLDPNLGASTWTTNGSSFTTQAGNNPTPITALALTNSSAASQVWTLTIPVNNCYQVRVDSIKWDYRASGTSYNTMLTSVNGTGVAFNNALNTSGSFRTDGATAFSPITVSSALSIAFEMSGGTHGSGGTFRLDNIRVYGAVTGTGAACSPGSVTAGNAVPAATTFCGSGSVALSLSGASTGCGITYQWQSSTNPLSGFGNIGGATSATYNTGTVSSTTYYRAIVTCSGTPSTSAVAAVTVNSLPGASISGATSTPLVIGGSTLPLTGSPAGGFWSSSKPSVATVNGSGVVAPGTVGGTARIVYLRTAGGCTSSDTATVNVVWPNTLALYVGENGNSTNVIPVPGETVSTLAPTSFGTNGACSDGGLSGLTVPTSVTAFSQTGPHVGFTITPNAGKSVNIFRIRAVTRESAQGPTKAVIAYRISPSTTWINETVDVPQNVGGSCGAASTSWDFQPTLNLQDVRTPVEVAVFPFAPGANTGTFQLNNLEVYGIVTDTTKCSHFAAGAVMPSSMNICGDTGSRWLNYDFAAGAAGPGVTYQWQELIAGTWTPIGGATNASYRTPVLNAPSTHYYRVVSTCNGTSLNSAPDTIRVTSIPVPTFVFTPPYLRIEDPAVDLNPYTTNPGGGYAWWSSNFISSTPVDSATGFASGVIPGIAIISYRYVVNGCTGVARDTIRTIHNNSLAVYLGTGGNSTAITPATGISVTSALSHNYTTGTPCGSGGLSGLINTASTYSSAGPVAKFTITSAVGGNVDEIRATTRRSGTGPQSYRIAYRNPAGSGSWMDNGTNLVVDLDDCGYSANELVFGSLGIDLSIDPSIEVGIFAFDGAPTGTFQLNTVSVLGSGAALRPAPNAVGNINIAEGIKVYPNPTTNILNVASAEKVNVTILSIDGKKLIEQQDAKSINVSNLASGMYLIQVSDANNALIKTAKFTKQ